ncbi:MAG: GNAT family N-acetyltransferase [Anaerolineales bacterium]|nr:GNAT family N-acetyltransferase [Anaerolineales bacterium]
MNIIETDRLILRRLSTDDAEFILGLLNQPSFIDFIGDRGVRTLEDASRYILQGAIASYERFGFGLYLTLQKESEIPIGICGLVKRETLKDADVGFAFLPQYWSKGYAFESASAVMDYAKNTLGLKRILGITTSNNQSSIHVLEKIGLKFEQMVNLSEDDVELKLFALDL